MERQSRLSLSLSLSLLQYRCFCFCVWILLYDKTVLWMHSPISFLVGVGSDDRWMDLLSSLMSGRSHPPIRPGQNDSFKKHGYFGSIFTKFRLNPKIHRKGQILSNEIFKYFVVSHHVSWTSSSTYQCESEASHNLQDLELGTACTCKWQRGTTSTTYCKLSRQGQRSFFINKNLQQQQTTPSKRRGLVC